MIKVTRDFCDDRSIDTQQHRNRSADDADNGDEPDDEDVFVVLDFNHQSNEIPQTPTDDRVGLEGSNTEKRETHILIHKDTDYDEHGYCRQDTDKLSVDNQSSTMSVLSIRNTNNHNNSNKKRIPIPISPITLPSNDTDTTNTQITNTPLPSPGSLTSLNLNTHSLTVHTNRLHRDKNWNLNLSLKHLNMNMVEIEPASTDTNEIAIDDESNKTGIVCYIFNGVQFSQDMLAVELPNGVQQSNILTQFPHNVVKQSIALYRKYIKSDSDLEINIPYRIRENITEKIQLLIEDEKNKGNDCVKNGDDDKEDMQSDDDQNLDAFNEGDLYLLFDESCVSILRLLVASFKRFKTSKGFEEYLNETNKNGLNGSTVMLDLPSQLSVGYQYKPSVYDGNMYEQILAKYSV